ncbi:MAG: acetyltransferase [Siphonobacter sp.]
MKDRVIIVGSSGHARVIIDIFEKMGVQIIGLLDRFRSLGEQTAGYPILSTNYDELQSLSEQYPTAKYFVAIGDNWIRQKEIDLLISYLPGIEFIQAIHPSAQLASDVKLGKGVAVMAGAIVNANTIVEDFAIINTKASLDHDCFLGKAASLAPGVTTGGKVSIGNYAVVAMGAVLKHGITVGEHALIGTGAVVLTDCPEKSIMYGCPAKWIRNREIGEKYL